MAFFFQLCYRNNPERTLWRFWRHPRPAMKSRWNPDLTSVYRSPFTVQLLLLFLLVGSAFPLQAPPPTSGFTVDISRREQSRSFYNALYPASEGVPPGWNGDLATCTAGTTSDSFKAAITLRINYFRAMAGVPATITFSDLYSVKSQQAALMMSRNNALNHKPPTTWFCYSAAGYEAAGKSNLALGAGGAEAIAGSMMDYGAGNSAAGHRRWLLYPQTLFMGSGDIPATTGYPAASSLWVTDDNYGAARPTTREEFVAWPPPGFVPYDTVFPRWSFAYPGADFSGSGVAMTRNGISLPVRLEPIAANVGENTLVWVPDSLVTTTAATFPRPTADTPYTVTVSNVKIGGISRSFTYSVTLFDPQIPGADEVSAVIAGPAAPPVALASSYTVTAVPTAESYQWRSAGISPFTGAYNAENGMVGITTLLSSGYSPIAGGVSASGSASYHLASPGSATVNPTDQVLTLDRTFLAGPSSKLRFQSRLGWASANQKGVVELSADGGSTWQQLFSQAGSGGAGETGFTLRTLDLSAYAERIITLRFAYRLTSGSYYPQTDPGAGWCLDDIAPDLLWEVTGDTLSPVTATPSFDFTPPTVGNYALLARPLLYGAYPLEWGAVFRISALEPSQLSLSLTGSGGGTVTSDPPGISCPHGDCVKKFPTGSPVLLLATSDSDSLFGGWTGGGCSGGERCSVPLSSATAVISRFDYVQPLRVPLATSVEFSSLPLAYGAVPDGGSILARTFTFPGNLLLDKDKLLFLRGGYDTSFAHASGISVLNGQLTLSRGSLVASGIIIR